MIGISTYGIIAFMRNLKLPCFPEVMRLIWKAIMNPPRKTM